MKIYRKANSVKGSFDIDINASDTSIHKDNEAVMLQFTTGMSGGKTDFLLVLEDYEVRSMIQLCVDALVATQFKELKDYDIDELLVAIKAKTEE